MPKDKPYVPVESQEMTIEPDEAPIGGLDPETSRKKLKKGPIYLLNPGTWKKQMIRVETLRVITHCYNLLISGI